MKRILEFGVFELIDLALKLSSFLFRESRFGWRGTGWGCVMLTIIRGAVGRVSSAFAMKRGIGDDWKYNTVVGSINVPEENEINHKALALGIASKVQGGGWVTREK